DRTAVARGAEGARGSRSHVLPEQPQAARPRLSQLPRYQSPLPLCDRGEPELVGYFLLASQRTPVHGTERDLQSGDSNQRDNGSGCQENPGAVVSQRSPDSTVQLGQCGGCGVDWWVGEVVLCLRGGRPGHP